MIRQFTAPQGQDEPDRNQEHIHPALATAPLRLQVATGNIPPLSPTVMRQNIVDRAELGILVTLVTQYETQQKKGGEKKGTSRTGASPAEVPIRAAAARASVAVPRLPVREISSFGREPASEPTRSLTRISISAAPAHYGPALARAVEQMLARDQDSGSRRVLTRTLGGYSESTGRA